MTNRRRKQGVVGKVWVVPIMQETVQSGIHGPQFVVWKMTWWNRPYYALKNFLSNIYDQSETETSPDGPRKTARG